jgi:hypothetical protein
MAPVTASSEWGRIAFRGAAAYRLGGERYRVDAVPASNALSGSQPLFPDIEGGQYWAGRAAHDGVVLLSERFTTDGALSAVRVGLINRSGQDLELEQLLPVIVGTGDLSLGHVPVSEWVLLRQPRMKNDLPACVRLGSTGEEVWDAVRGTPETGGAPRPADPAAPPPGRFVCSELAVLGTGVAAQERGAVALGFAPITDYLTRIDVTLSDDRCALQSLRMACEGDRQVIAPGGQVWSQWAVLVFAETMEEAIARYTAVLKTHSPCRATASERAPAVWCSWYYYGDGFSQEELAHNLDWLEEHPLPVDAVQIDECWDLRWGEWFPNARWPDLGGTATRIRALGYQPGIWTCGFLTEPRAHARYHQPGWLLRDRQGEPIRFRMNSMENYVLDPTHPEVQAFLEETYRRLTEQYGYTYHKVDFTRAVAHPEAVFHDRTANRAQAYRMGLGAIRRGIGEEAYLNICGGLYGPSLGVVDAQRTGSDTKGTWPAHPDGDPGKPFGPFTIKQNTLRFWMNELWHNDPDAAMIRRRAVPYRDEKLSIGTMNDVEAETTVLNQYLTGGIVCFTENLREIDADRLLLYRRCIPGIGRAAVPRDLQYGGRFPALFDSAVRPRAPQLEPWHTVSVVNWCGVPSSFRFRLSEVLTGPYLELAEQFLVSAYSGKWHRLVPPSGEVAIDDVPPHGCEVVKVQPYRPGEPHLLRTDGHFSMGGVEVTKWQVGGKRLCIEGQWGWPCSLVLEVLLPDGEAGRAMRLHVAASARGRQDFELQVHYPR